MERIYFEVFNQANVDIVDLNESPIEEFTEKGIRTKEGTVGFDVVVLATGFDSMTGGFTQIDIHGTDGRLLKDHWKNDVHTYLGLGVHNFPNMLIVYGPQSPAAGANGPTVIEFQSQTVADIISYARSQGYTRVEPETKSEDHWKAATNDAWANTLFPKASSWYQGANIPGKKVEALNW